MNSLCEVATQCLAVKKVLAQLKPRVHDEYFESVLESSLRTLDAYSLELCPWTGKKNEGQAVSFYFWKERDTLIEVCRLRMELLEETLRESLTTPLPRILRQQLSGYLYEFTDIKAMLETIFNKLSETRADLFSSGVLKNSVSREAFVRA